MEVGVGLPAAVPGTGGELLLEWARWAEQGPFASLGVLDRVAYDNYDPLLSLAFAAAVTTRPRLVTMVVIAPLRGPALLAKEAASRSGSPSAHGTRTTTSLESTTATAASASTSSSPTCAMPGSRAASARGRPSRT